MCASWCFCPYSESTSQLDQTKTGRASFFALLWLVNYFSFGNQPFPTLHLLPLWPSSWKPKYGHPKSIRRKFKFSHVFRTLTVDPICADLVAQLVTSYLEHLPIYPQQHPLVSFYCSNSGKLGINTKTSWC